MNIIVANRNTAEQNNYFDSLNFKHIIISITDPYSSDADLKLNDQCVDILRLKFHDVDKPFYHDGELIESISDDDAYAIAKFVTSYNKNIDNIIIHCEAGVSRSAGIAAALSLIFNGNDEEFFSKPYIPNMYCYRKILDFFNFSILESDLRDKIINHPILSIREKRGIYNELF